MKRVYMAGSMEGRTYEELFYEHYYIRNQLVGLNLQVFDPLLKEKHKPGTKVGLKGCGMNPLDVYKNDLNAVEKADIVFWITGDIQSEGSITEISWAGCMNRYNHKPTKTIVIVSPRRCSKKLNHFANMHKGVKVVKSVADGLAFIKRKFKLKGV